MYPAIAWDILEELRDIELTGTVDFVDLAPISSRLADRYSVAPGDVQYVALTLATDDVADTGTGPDGTRWSEALPWDEVRARIAADDALTLHTPTGPELFVSEICLIAGPEFGRMDKNKFLKNLRNAVTFKSVTSATDFVRNFILDSQPVSVADMRASIARYAEIEKKIVELKDRLAQVGALGARIGNVRSQRATLARRRLASLQGHLHLACAKLGQLMARKRDIETSVAGKAAALGRLEERKAAAADRLRTLEASQAADAVILALNSVAFEIREIDVRLGEWRNQESVAAAVRLVARSAVSAPFAEAVAPEAMARVDPTLRRTRCVSPPPSCRPPRQRS